MVTTAQSPDKDYYFNLLLPLFDSTYRKTVDSLFEYVCCLVRPTGIQMEGWDPLIESTELVTNLTALSRMELAGDAFPNPERTRARIALVSYCHLTEVDFFYELIVNLLRVRCGEKFQMMPFHDLAKPVKHKSTGFIEKYLPPNPTKKIARIGELSRKAGLPDVGAVWAEIHYGDIRNAVFHADYTLTDTEFRMMKGRYSSSKGYLTPVVPLADLEAIFMRTFAFYSALLAHHKRARLAFADFKDKALPYDLHYKGLVEFLYDGAAVSGVRVYWPNGSISELSRTDKEAVSLNVSPDPDGSINFMVGLYASKPGMFSPLVEHDARPVYTPAPGRTQPPYWPDKLGPISLV
jgi:hypothetical protein